VLGRGRPGQYDGGGDPNYLTFQSDASKGVQEQTWLETAEICQQRVTICAEMFIPLFGIYHVANKLNYPGTNRRHYRSRRRFCSPFSGRNRTRDPLECTLPNPTG
jgi:hypothetical protein